MTERANTYSESLGQSTTTSTSYGDKAAITFTPEANAAYWLLASAAIGQSSNSRDVKLRLQNDTGAATLREHNHEVHPGNTARDVVLMVDKFVAGASPPSQTFSLEFCTENALGTASCESATLLALKAHDDDEYAEDESELQDYSGEDFDYVTLNFTPASSGDYLIIATTESRCDSEGQEFRLKVGSTEYCSQRRGPKDGTNYYNWAAMVKVTLAASSQTIKIIGHQYGTLQGMYVRRGSILALRLDAQANNYYAESRSRDSTTSTTFQDKVTLTQTPEARAHLIFANGVIDTYDLNEEGEARLEKGGSAQVTHIQAAGLQDDLTWNERSLAHFRKETLSASSTTWKTQYRTTNTADTVGFQESSIAVLDLEEASGGGGDQTKSVSDTAAATDALAISVALGLGDSGSGAEALGPSAAVLLSDTSSAADTLAIAVALGLADSGAGAESFGASAAVPLADAGAGSDALTIGVSVALSDAAAASDAVSVLTALLKSIADSGAGSEALAIAVAAALADAGAGSETPAIGVSLGLADTGAGADAIVASVALTIVDSGGGADVVTLLQATLIAIADAAAASEAIGISVAVPLSDAGAGAELLGITALLQVLEQGSGMDVAVRFDANVRIASISFTKRTRSIGFSLAQRRIDFTLN